MTQLTYDSVAVEVYRVGIRGEAAAIAVAITQPESGRDPTKHNLTPSTGDDSWGLWQINTVPAAGGLERLRPIGVTSKQQLLDPGINARAMNLVSGGGSNWKPWTTYNHGLHKPYLTEARRAVQGVEARGGSGGAGVGAPSGSTSGTTAAAPVLTEDFVASIPKGLRDDYNPSRFIDGFVIRGLAAGKTILDQQLLTGSFSLTTTEILQVNLTVGPVGKAGSAGWLDVANLLVEDTPVDWKDLHLLVASVRWAEGAGGLPAYTAEMRDAGATKMRDVVNRNERDWAGWSPTQVMQGIAAENSMRFVGKGTNTRDTIARKGETASGGTGAPQPAESSYELGQRLAREEGFWFFVWGGVMYFAPPSWLAARMPRFSADLGGIGAPSDAQGGSTTGVIGIPECERTRAADIQPGDPRRTVTLRLPRWRGEQIRPGYGCDFSGMPYFAGGYIVTDVSWPLDGGLEPATVVMQDPTDPVPQPDSSDPADTADGSASTSAATASTSTGTSAMKASHSALDMVTVALRQVGDKYVYGAEVALNDPDPTTFDCSELIQWACAQVGVSFADGSANQINAIASVKLTRTIAQAARIRGALLWREGHVALSLGDGKSTVEARGRAYGVVQYEIGTRFSRAGLIPGLVYPAGS